MGRDENDAPLPLGLFNLVVTRSSDLTYTQLITCQCLKSTSFLISDHFLTSFYVERTAPPPQLRGLNHHLCLITPMNTKVYVTLYLNLTSATAFYLILYIELTYKTFFSEE